MVFPQKGIDAIRALYKANPQDEEARRHDIKLVGEQMCFDLGNKWGNKVRAGLDPVTSLSADSIAFREDDGTTSVWDIQSSSGQILVNAGDPPTFPNLPQSEATFVPCAPVNHMGSNGGEEPPPPSDEKLDQILHNQEVILANQNAIMQVQNEQSMILMQIVEKLNEPATIKVKFPDYRGRVTLLRDTTLFPEPRETES